MPLPGFDDPALASIPPAGNLYFGQDIATSVKVPPDISTERNPGYGQSKDLYHGGQPDVPALMFGEGTAYTGQGDKIVNASQSSRGHYSEILNFHGSPAPWVLLGLLLALGVLHLEANAKFRGKL